MLDKLFLYISSCRRFAYLVFMSA